MIGAINYLRTLRETCREAEGRCRVCPLGKDPDINKTLCPRLTDPRAWSDEKTSKMVYERR